ncbi:MAG: hypothetical protein KDD66_14935 [Bdellovibrionales bacterium]|nr:hypothetical protein [Bdellovibrionales bacterium]
MKLSLQLFAAIIGLVVCTAGCSSDDNDFVNADVVRINLSDSTIAVGEGSVVAVEFSFSSNAVFSNEKTLYLVIRLDSSLMLREGTSEIDGFTSSADKSVGAQITECPESGETILLYALDRFDLDEADNPSGDADARLNFTIDGIAADSEAIISARADDENLMQSCETSLVPEAVTSLIVAGV